MPTPTGPLAPAVTAGISIGVPYITTVDKWGGNQGVDINGVIGTVGIIVMPPERIHAEDTIKSA
jgi:hypothetical protein